MAKSKTGRSSLLQMFEKEKESAVLTCADNQKREFKTINPKLPVLA